MYESPRLISVNTVNAVYGVGPACMGCAVAVAVVAVAVGAAISVGVAVNAAVAVNVAVAVNAVVNGYSPAGALDPRLAQRLASASV